ncbi:MAG: hypothetical protein Q8N63_07240 [Nanoarchaeota archaeon]|nr:hypothetical protein [Nanoarchaeota archaeon]
MTENKGLSLDEMLSLAERVESWYYVPRYEALFGCVIAVSYRGKVEGFEITVGDEAVTPWFGRYRYIEAKYGNLVLGEFPPYKDLKFDKRLESLYNKIPMKIRQQGLDTARKIKESQTHQTKHL